MEKEENQAEVDEKAKKAIALKLKGDADEAIKAQEKANALKMKEIKENTPVQDQLITKAAAAIEVRKQARQVFLMSIGGIGLAFLSGIGASINIIVGCVITGVGAIILGWFAVQSRNKIKYLDQTYKL